MKIGFKCDYVKGKFDTDTDKLVCVPKYKYHSVTLCLRTTGMHLPFAEIKLYEQDRFSDAQEMFPDASALGEEIVRRWNEYAELEAYRIMEEIGRELKKKGGR